MSSGVDLRALVKAIGERPVVVYPAYRRLVGGSWGAAAMLAQIVYWWQVVGGRPFHKTDFEIATELGMTSKELETAKRHIRQVPGVRITREGMPARTHYDIDPEAFAAAISEAATNAEEAPAVSRDGETSFHRTGVTSFHHSHGTDQTEKTTESITTTPPTPPTDGGTGAGPGGGGGEARAKTKPLPSGRDLAARYAQRAEEVRLALSEPDVDLYVQFRAALRDRMRSEHAYRRWLAEAIWPELQRLGARRFREVVATAAPRLVDPAIKHPTAWLLSKLQAAEPSADRRWNVSQMWAGLEYRPVDDDGHPVLDPVTEAERDDLLARGLARWIGEAAS